MVGGERPVPVSCSPAGAGGWKPGPGLGMEHGGGQGWQKTEAGLMKYGLTDPGND